MSYLAKLRDKGLLWCCRRVAGRLLQPLQRPIRRALGILRWISPTLNGLFSSTGLDDRRLLMIYDLSSQPFSIGDILVIQEASLVLREKYHLGSVDFALVYNPQRPASTDPSFAKITETNVLYHLASILPAAQVNQHHGSLFIFNSHSRLQRFISDSADLYQVWPSALKFAERQYMYYTVFNDLLHNYYEEHGTIPHLSCRQHMIDWAQTFYCQHVYPDLPVTVQLRNNKGFATHRNSRLECWLEFFRYCEERYQVKFVVVGALSEVDERMRQCSNVIIAKDYFTNIEQDLALIHSAAIHMGASSGPGAMAVFNGKPYLYVNTDPLPRLNVLVREGSFLRYEFANPLQRQTLGPETTELLIEEFDRIWNSIDVSKWMSPTTGDHKMEKEHLTWLR